MTDNKKVLKTKRFELPPDGNWDYWECAYCEQVSPDYDFRATKVYMTPIGGYPWDSLSIYFRCPKCGERVRNPNGEITPNKRV